MKQNCWLARSIATGLLLLASGCALPNRGTGQLGGLSATRPPAISSPAEQPLPPQYAASRATTSRGQSPGIKIGSTQMHVGAAISSDDGVTGGVTLERQAPPRQQTEVELRGTQPYGPAYDRPASYDEEASGSTDDDFSMRWPMSNATRTVYSPAASRYGDNNQPIVIRGQSPGFGGSALAPLPHRIAGPAPAATNAVYDSAPGTFGHTATPAGGLPFVSAGAGVNDRYAVQPAANTTYQPNTVYQPGTFPPPPPPAATGWPAAPVMQPPFTPQSPLVVPDEDLPLVNPDVIVQETQTGRLMVGVGVNSDAGLVGNLVIDEQNFDIFRPSLRWNDWVNGTAFRGAGQRFRIEAMPGTQVQRYSFNFQDPYFLDTPFSFGVSAFYFQRNYTDWDEGRYGGRLSLGYLFPERPDLSLSGSFGAENVNISDPAVPTPPQLAEVVGNNSLYTARLQLAHDTRDSTFMPTEGHFISLATEYGFGTFQFPRFEGDFRQYWVMRERPDGSGRHVLGASAKVGVSGSDTPIFEHFFAGGFSTLRGFAFRGASPQEMNVIVGGEFQLLTSLEYRFPLTANDMLYGSFFVDAGTVEPNANLYAQDFRVTPGFELRINIPQMGPIPIAVGIGVPVAHAPGDDIQNFHFFVGMVR